MKIKFCSKSKRTSISTEIRGCATSLKRKKIDLDSSVNPVSKSASLTDEVPFI